VRPRHRARYQRREQTLRRAIRRDELDALVGDERDPVASRRPFRDAAPCLRFIGAALHDHLRGSAAAGATAHLHRRAAVLGRERDPFAVMRPARRRFVRIGRAFEANRRTAADRRDPDREAVGTKKSIRRVSGPSRARPTVGDRGIVERPTDVQSGDPRREEHAGSDAAPRFARSRRRPDSLPFAGATDAAKRVTVAKLRGASFVPVVQAAEAGNRHDLAVTRRGDRTGDWRIFVERQVRSRLQVCVGDSSMSTTTGCRGDATRRPCPVSRSRVPFASRSRLMTARPRASGRLSQDAAAVVGFAAARAVDGGGQGSRGVARRVSARRHEASPEGTSARTSSRPEPTGLGPPIQQHQHVRGVQEAHAFRSRLRDDHRPFTDAAQVLEHATSVCSGETGPPK